MKKAPRIFIIVLLPLILIIQACSDLIEYNPYDTDVKTHDINAEGSAGITGKISSESDTLKFVLFSDIHDNYDDILDAINCINNQHGLQFAVCCGDITNAGLKQEFEWYGDIANKSKIPVITLIGNHDYLSNGYQIYKRIFGQSNMSFIAGKYKFILFDDIIWEKNNQMPDYAWLAGELSDTGTHNIVLAHIPPFSEEMQGAYYLGYSQVVDSCNTILCLHGHCHSFAETTFNGIHTIVSAAINDREYYIVNLIGGQSFIERVSF